MNHIANIFKFNRFLEPPFLYTNTLFTKDHISLLSLGMYQFCYGHMTEFCTQRRCIAFVEL